MKIKYVGGRSRMDISFNRKPYYFTPENNRTLDIKDKAVRDYIFSLPNRGEFETVEEPENLIFNPENNTVTTGTENIITQELKIKKPKFKKGRK